MFLRRTNLIFILGVVIFALGFGVFLVWNQGEQNKLAHQRALMYLEGAKLETELKNKRQKDIETCILDAEKEYERLLELNSVEGTTPGGDKARRWNNDEIAEKVESNFREDKEFCLNQFPK